MVADRPTKCIDEWDGEYAEQCRQQSQTRLAVSEHQPAMKERVVEGRVPGINECAPTPQLGKRFPCEAKARSLIHPERLRSDPVEAEYRPQGHQQENRSHRRLAVRLRSPNRRVCRDPALESQRTPRPTGRGSRRALALRIHRVRRVTHRTSLCALRCCRVKDRIRIVDRSPRPNGHLDGLSA